mmetsp:Transcript_42807/g.79330  ORF Transcript_42807/g.79330 Transcript_42807/m.79330 type:complete len:485 (+) Transcript_42807:110-1564(+)
MAIGETTPLRSKDALENLPSYTYVTACFASLNSVNLGFDIGVSSGIGLLIQEDMDLTDWQLGFFMGCIQLMAAIGAMCSHEISDRFGRCMTFTFAQVIFLIGICILGTAYNFFLLILGRLFLGFAIGLSLAIDPMYITEIAPGKHRGKLTTLSEIAINVGIVLGFVVNWCLADLPDGTDWRVMVACGAILPLTLLVLSITVMPESPRWLVANGRTEEAESILTKTHPAGENISSVVEGIRQQIEETKSILELGWQPLLKPDPVTRYLMIVGMGVAFTQQLTGIESIIMYSPEIFKRAGVATTHKELFFVTIIMGVLKTLVIVVSACYLDNLGRRPLLILSTVGMSISDFLLGWAIYVKWSIGAVAGVCSFVTFFSIGIGPVCWLLASEVFPVQIRAKAMSVATTLNRIASGFVATTFLPMAGFLTLAGYFWLFSGVIAVIFLWTCVYIPETKQRTLEQLVKDLGEDILKDEEQATRRAESGAKA